MERCCMKKSKKKLKTYEVHYRNDQKDGTPYEKHQFQAKNEYEARLLALEFCDENWYKFYGVLQIK